MNKTCIPPNTKSGVYNPCKINILQVFRTNPSDFFLIQEASGFEGIMFDSMKKIYGKSRDEESIIYYNESYEHILTHIGEFSLGRPYIIAAFIKDTFWTVIINVHLPESVDEYTIQNYKRKNPGSYSQTDEEIINIIKYNELIKIEEGLDDNLKKLLKNKSTRIIISGDFNWEIKSIEDFDSDNIIIFNRLFQVGSPPYNTCCDFELNGEDYTVQFDHVLISNNNLKIIKFDNPLKGVHPSRHSDHLPIYCEINHIDEGRKLINYININANEIIKNYQKIKELDDHNLLKIPDCKESILPSDSTKRPFFLFHGKPSSMINYHYIWVLYDEKTNKQILNSQMDSKINKIISDYSFPMCILNIDLSFSSKQAIINDEYSFIKMKILEIEEAEIKIKLFQIPRIIYDLYGIIFRRNNIYMHDFILYVDPENKVGVNQYSQFFININKKYDEQILNIIKLNNEFISLIYEKNLMNKFFESEINTDVYIELYEILFDIILRKSIHLMPLGKSPSATLQKLTSIDTIENLFNYRFKSILYQTLLLELGFIYDNITDKYILNERKDLFILYRGYSGNIFSTLNNGEPHSNSFNTSILNGIFEDSGANTYNYMKPGCNKHFYLVPRFLPNSSILLIAFDIHKITRFTGDKLALLKAFPDNENLNELLFIPPIHPFLLLYGNGEYWHARSKIHVNSVIRATGLFDDNTNFIKSKKTAEQLENIFKIYFVDSPQPKVLVDKYYSKYLKYKNKYLNLKISIKN